MKILIKPDLKKIYNYGGCSSKCGAQCYADCRGLACPFK